MRRKKPNRRTSKRIKHRGKSSSPPGSAPRWHYGGGTGRSTTDLEEYLLVNTPHASKPEPEIPRSVDQIEIIIKKRLPKDLEARIHPDGRITIPLDAKHRASNWPDILKYLDWLDATEEQKEALADKTEQLIIETLRNKGKTRVVNENNQETKPAEHESSYKFADASSGQDTGYFEKTSDQTPEHPFGKKLKIVEKNNDLELLSAAELYDLATDIQDHLLREPSESIRQTRSTVVKAFAKACANGVCQFCDNPAQYTEQNGTPRLIVHHIVFLRNGGEDTVENVVAICPNCHDFIHLMKDDAHANFLKNKVTNLLWLYANSCG